MALRSIQEPPVTPHDNKTGENARLIASDRVEGTAVYSRDGERLDSIYTLMIDKRSGQVDYAVLSFGGLLGVGTTIARWPGRS